MKNLIFVLLLFAVNSIVYGELKFEILPEYLNLGKLGKEDGFLSKKVEVLNKGESDLTLKFIAGSCGCATIKEFDKVIKPKKRGVIEIEVRPLSNGKGAKTQELLFEFAGPEKKLVNIKIEWFLRLSDVEISPDNIELELTCEEIEKSKGKSENTIVILDAWEKKLEISDIRTSDNLSACFYDMLYRCSKGSEVHVCRFETMLHPTLRGKFNERLSFKTNHPDYPEIDIPITGRILSQITVMPKTLIFSGRSLEKKIVKLNSVTGDMTVDKILTSDSNIKTTVIKSSNNLIELEVTYDNCAGHQEEKIKTEHIYIETSSPAQESINIQVLIL